MECVDVGAEASEIELGINEPLLAMVVDYLESLSDEEYFALRMELWGY